VAFGLIADTGIFDTRIEFWLSHSYNSFNIYAALQNDAMAHFSYFLGSWLSHRLNAESGTL
jgi:hypothetical protein